MTQAVVKLLKEVDKLSPEEYYELWDEMIIRQGKMETLPDIEGAQIDEVRRRIEEVESGEVELLDGDEVLAEVRAMVFGPQDSK
jgi:hypothetical protein